MLYSSQLNNNFDIICVRKHAIRTQAQTQGSSGNKKNNPFIGRTNGTSTKFGPPFRELGRQESSRGGGPQLSFCSSCHPPLSVTPALCSRPATSALRYPSATPALHFWYAAPAARLQSAQLLSCSSWETPCRSVSHVLMFLSCTEVLSIIISSLVDGVPDSETLFTWLILWFCHRIKTETFIPILHLGPTLIPDIYICSQERHSLKLLCTCGHKINILSQTYTHKHIASSAVADHTKSTAVSCWYCMLMLSWSASSLATFSQHQQAVNHTEEKCVCKCVCMCVIEDIDETVRIRVEQVHRFFLSLFLSVALLFSLFLSEVSNTLSSLLCPNTGTRKPIVFVLFLKFAQ